MLDLALAGLDLSDLLTAAGAAAGGLLAGGAAGRRVGRRDLEDVLQRSGRAQDSVFAAAQRVAAVEDPSQFDEMPPPRSLWRVLLPALLELAGELVRWIGSRRGRKDGRAALVFPLMLAAVGGVLWRWGWGAALAVLVGLVLLEVVRQVVGGRRSGAPWTLELEELDEDGPDWKRRGRAGVVTAAAVAGLGFITCAVLLRLPRELADRLELLEHRADELEEHDEAQDAHLRAHDLVLELEYPARGRQVFPNDEPAGR